MSSTATIADGHQVKLDLDSAAAVLARDRRYLLQHRDDRVGVSYPGWWSLFGGAREGDESAEQAIRRELREELEFEVVECRHLITCWYDIAYEGRTTRKAFFAIELPPGPAFVLHEGQAMAWFTLGEILAMGDRVVPYDLGILALYDGLRTP